MMTLGFRHSSLGAEGFGADLGGNVAALDDLETKFFGAAVGQMHSFFDPRGIGDIQLIRVRTGGDDIEPRTTGSGSSKGSTGMPYFRLFSLAKVSQWAWVGLYTFT